MNEGANDPTRSALNCTIEILPGPQPSSTATPCPICDSADGACSTETSAVGDDTYASCAHATEQHKRSRLPGHDGQTWEHILSESGPPPFRLRRHRDHEAKTDNDARGHRRCHSR